MDIFLDQRSLFFGLPLFLEVAVSDGIGAYVVWESQCFHKGQKHQAHRGLITSGLKEETVSELFYPPATRAQH